MGKKHDYMKEGRSCALQMESATRDGAQKKAFEDAKKAYINAIKHSIADDSCEYKDAWRGLGRLYSHRARQEMSVKNQKLLWNCAALAFARFLFLDKRDNGTLDQDARIKLENLERRKENKVLFEGVIGAVVYPLRGYIEKHERYPPLPDVYGGGDEEVPYGLV